MRLIDGDALKEAFYQKMKELLKSTDTPQISNEALSLLCGSSLITETPTIERKKGRWLPDNNCYYETRYICSECKLPFRVETFMMKPSWRFCPNCGADMRGNDE